MGPCYFEGTAIRIQGWRLSTGFTYVAKGDSGQVSADLGTIDSEEFTLAIDTDSINLSTWMGDGSAISSGTDVYLRAVGVADSVAAHVKVSVSAGTYTTPSMSVSGQADASGSIVAQCQVRPTISINQVIPATAVGNFTASALVPESKLEKAVDEPALFLIELSRLPPVF